MANAAMAGGVAIAAVCNLVTAPVAFGIGLLSGGYVIRAFGSKVMVYDDKDEFASTEQGYEIQVAIHPGRSDFPHRLISMMPIKTERPFALSGCYPERCDMYYPILPIILLNAV